MKYKKEEILFLILRLSIGWIFLWSFLDKLFGLGITTAADKSWLLGNSPTTGFLTNSPTGPFAMVFNSMAGNAVVDWLFMIGLLLIGLCLILGIGMKIASYSGSVFMLLIWIAVLPPEHNPLIDEHIIYAVILLLLAKIDSGQWFGLGNRWNKIKIVKKWRILK